MKIEITIIVNPNSGINCNEFLSIASYIEEILMASNEVKINYFLPISRNSGLSKLMFTYT